jgi:hypothetical protein
MKNLSITILSALTLLAAAPGAAWADTLSCTVTSAEGVFDSYIAPHEGDTLSLDLEQGPRAGQLRFVRAEGTGLDFSYIPLAHPWERNEACGRTTWSSGDITLTVRDFGESPIVVNIDQSLPPDSSPNIHPSHLEMSCTR